MIEVPLRSRDGTVRAVALIDEVDAWALETRWSLDSYGYAKRQIIHGGRRTTELLHRTIGYYETAEEAAEAAAEFRKTHMPYAVEREG